jgi:hypothetical protein
MKTRPSQGSVCAFLGADVLYVHEHASAQMWWGPLGHLPWVLERNSQGFSTACTEQ